MYSVFHRDTLIDLRVTGEHGNASNEASKYDKEIIEDKFTLLTIN